MKLFIRRDRYFKKIKPFINKNLIKVILGQRRVGKSTFLFQIMDEIKAKHPKSKFIYINKELHEFEDIKNHRDLLRYIKKEKGRRKKAYIFIDEIQDIIDFEKALRSLQAEGNDDLYCTGSNSNLLSGELATVLSGRYIELRMFGLSYAEFIKFHELRDSQETLMLYIKYGGLPYLIHLPLEDEIIYDYLRNIYSSILYKDIIRRYSIRNAVFLEQLVNYLGSNIGSLVSAKKISDYLKSQKTQLSTSVVINYLNYLATAFFVFKVPRTDVLGKKIFENNEKYYFEDLGLRHSILGYKQKDIGQVLENLIFLHLKIAGYQVYVGKMKNKEIDFFCQRRGEKLYVQVAYAIDNQKTHDREFGNLLAIKDNHRKIVVSMDETIGGGYEGIEHLHVRDFLMETAP